MKATFSVNKTLPFHVFAAQGAIRSCDAVGWLPMGHSCNLTLSFRFAELLNVALLFLSPLCFLLDRQKEVNFF